MDYGPPGSSIHGIFLERILEWVGISFSRGSLKPGIKPLSSASPVDSLPLSHRGSLILSIPATKCYSPLHTSWISFPAILPPPSANPNVPPTYFRECWAGIAQHEPLIFCLMDGEMETLAGKEDGSGWLELDSWFHLCLWCAYYIFLHCFVPLANFYCVIVCGFLNCFPRMLLWIRNSFLCLSIFTVTHRY